MARQLQLRRGTTSQNNSFIGAQGEVTYDIEANQLRYYDGSTQGGFKIPKDDDTVHKSNVPETINGSKTFTDLKALKTSNWSSGLVITSTALPDNYTSQESVQCVYPVMVTGNSNGGGEIGWLSVAREGTTSRIGMLVRARKTSSSANVGTSLSIAVDGDGNTLTNCPTPVSTGGNNQIATTGWVNDINGSTGVVHKTGTETIAGLKTFTHDMTINSKLKVTDEISGRFKTASCHIGSDNTNCWFKLGTFNSTGGYNSHQLVFKLFPHATWFNGGSVNGRIKTRSGGDGTAGTVINDNNNLIEFDSYPNWLSLSDFKLLYKANQGTEGNKYALYELWVKTNSTYTGYSLSIQEERDGSGNYSPNWTLYNKVKGDGTESQASLPSGYTQKDSIIANNSSNIIAYQTANSSNNYKWYRKYANGWVEQGGMWPHPSVGTYYKSVEITFPVAMRDSNYPVIVTNTGTNGTAYTRTISSKYTTKFVCNSEGDTARYNGFDWFVSGMAAA